MYSKSTYTKDDKNLNLEFIIYKIKNPQFSDNLSYLSLYRQQAAFTMGCQQKWLLG